MRRRSFLLAAALSCSAGCMPAWLFPRRTPRPLDPWQAARKDEVVPTEAATPSRKPTNILALSGGGSYGAYTAGILNGWTRSNRRPEFDVVTGISTGALIAPLAFLGSKYDDELRRFYTEVARDDVFRVRYWATIPFRDSVASGAPLRRILESNLTPGIVDEIAAEHAKGRRLYVATMNLETRRSVVWDIGAMAEKKTEESRKLIRDVILASCSIPGVFPPIALTVEVDGVPRRELHVDGGVTGPVFVPPGVIEGAPPGANLYVIVAGKFYSDAAAVQPRVFKVLTATGGALIHAQARRDVSNLYHMAELNGVNFHVSAVRDDFAARDNGIDFHPNEMHRLYVEGVRVGVSEDWLTHPPERSPGESPEIRTGPQLRRKD